MTDMTSGTGTPESTALAIGKLMGTVESLVATLKQQNDTAAISRKEFMDMFQGIRDDNASQLKIMQEHFEEDRRHFQKTADLETWKVDAKPKIDALWDSQNTQKGWLLAVGTIGSMIGGGIVASIEYFKK